MIGSANKNRWYLVYTKPRLENTGVKNLRNQGYEVFSPQIIFEKPDIKKENVKMEPMFPRYLFINFNIEKDNWTPIKSTIGISHIVSFGKQFANVPDEVVAYLRTITDKNDIFIHKIVKLEFQKGDKLVIKKGILEGKEAIFLSKKSKERVRVLLKLANRQIPAEIPSTNVGRKETAKIFKL